VNTEGVRVGNPAMCWCPPVARSCSSTCLMEIANRASTRCPQPRSGHGCRSRCCRSEESTEPLTAGFRAICIIMSRSVTCLMSVLRLATSSLPVVLHLGREIDDFTSYTWYEEIDEGDTRSRHGYMDLTDVPLPERSRCSPAVRCRSCGLSGLPCSNEGYLPRESAMRSSDPTCGPLRRRLIREIDAGA
jgi:hypothetical protein